MKKLLVLLLSLSMVLSLCACSKKTEDVKPDEPVLNETEGNDQEMTGSWTVVSEANSALLDDETKEKFEKATEGVTGIGLNPVALLATQVVAGTNYAWLCEGTIVTSEPKTEYVIAYIYENLQGDLELLSINDLTVSEEQGSNEELVGGWNVAEETYADPDADCKEVLNKALEGFVGSNFELIACTSHQVVAGMNHLMVCKQTLVTKEPVVKLAMLTVYESLDGECTVNDIKDIQLSVDGEAGSK